MDKSKSNVGSGNSIIIKSPAGSGEPTPPQPVLISIFEALAHTKRSSCVGSVAGMGSEFSAPLHSQNPGGFFMNMTIKAPGTDFYLPPTLGQFESAARQMIFAQYNGTVSSPHLRTGREYCLMMVDQPLDQIRESLCAVANQHFDISPQSVTERKMEIVDRYIVSDVGILTTAFYDADFDVTDSILDNWNGEQSRIIQVSGATPRQYQAYEIAHFDSSTPHGIVRGPWPRTRMSLSFSAQPFDDSEFSTLDLEQEHKKLTLGCCDFTYNR